MDHDFVIINSKGELEEKPRVVQMRQKWAKRANVIIDIDEYNMSDGSIVTIHGNHRTIKL